MLPHLGRYAAALGIILFLVPTSPAQRAEILWDTYGIPHIYAAETEHLFYAFGWAQMTNHADAVLRLYGLSSGRAAEVFGEAFLENDRLYHSLDLDTSARRIYASASPEMRRYLDAFVWGMNDFAETHPDRIADSLRVLLPVRVRDVANRLLATQLLFSPTIRSPIVAQWRRSAPAGEAAGSNAWAVSGPKSASGNAMLLANPHLPWSDEFRWFEAHLSGPDVEVYGATLIGLPVLAIALNERHGWTHTVNTQDWDDLYELTLVDNGYLFDGAVRSFEADTTLLQVRQAGGTSRTEPVVTRRSVHGPVIAIEGDRALARRAVLSERAFDQWWSMAGAATLAEFEEALRLQQVVGFTTTYADREGNVLHHYGAATPVRPVDERDFWESVVPGATSETLWHELHTYDELPGVTNPPSGWVQNANEASYWATWPLRFELGAFPDYFGPPRLSLRAQRSLDLIEAHEAITFDQMVALKHDTRLEMADRILDDLVAGARQLGSEGAHEAARVLETWDRTTNAESVGAVLFVLWAQRAVRAAAAQGGSLFAVPWSIDDPRNTPRGLADPAGAATHLEAAAEQLRELAGTLEVPWGDMNRLRLDDIDLPASGGPGQFGAFRVLSFQPDPDGRQRAVFGDTFVLAVEFGDAVRAEAVLAYGNASQPDSPHRTDQLRYISEQRLRPVWLTREEVQANLRELTIIRD